MTDIKFITEQDETGLGRIVVDGRFYGVPATALAILAIERERNRAAIAELLAVIKDAMITAGFENHPPRPWHFAAQRMIVKHETPTTTKEEN